jgi:outer membrane protein assembly factor BamA
MNSKNVTRRSVLAGIVGFGTASVSTKTAAQQSTSQSGWHRYQYDNRNSGYNPDTSGPRSGVGIEWSTEIGGSDLVSDGESIYISYSGVIRKYSIEDGEYQWEYSTNTETQFKPLTYAEGSIYA